MEYRRFNDTVVLRVNRGEELIEAITTVAKKETIRLGSVSGIGACDSVDIMVYDVAAQVYEKNTLNEALELTSLNGNISEMDGECYVHLHANFGDSRGLIYGGHLNRAQISGTGEIFIQIVNGHADRSKDAETGLNLFDFNK